MRPRLLLMVALLMPFAGLVSAVPPAAQPWAAHDAGAEVRHVAIAPDGATIAAAIAPTVTSTPGGPLQQPTSSRPDLAILDAETGFAKNGTTPTGGPFGRNLTAVSQDGRTVVSVGMDPSQIVVGTLPESRIRLYLNRLSADPRWSVGAAETNFTRILDGAVPVRLLLSTDGARVALAAQAGADMIVYGFNSGGSSFVDQFRFRATGNVTDLAGTPDLGLLAVTGRVPQGNETNAVVHVLTFAAGSTPARSHFDRTANGTLFTSAAFTADGNRLIVGDARGQLHVFTGGNAAPAFLLPGQTSPVTRVLVAHDGARIAAIMGRQVALYDGTIAPPSLLYNATQPGEIADVAANRTLGTMALAVNGTGVVGLGDLSATPLWTMPGVITHVALSSSGDLLAYSTRTAIAAARLTRAVSLEHVGGGDTGPTKPVRPQGSVTFELQVRNTGAAVERLRLDITRELDLTVTTDPPVVSVAPDDVARVNVTVRTGPLFAGTRTLNVTAISLTSNAQDAAAITLTLQDEADVRFLLNDTGDIAMKPGETRLVLLGVQNNGSSDAAVGIRAVQTVSAGASWGVDIDPASLTLAPNSVTTVRVTVRPPPGVADGTSSTVKFSLEGTNVSDEVQLTFRINPTLGVEVNAVGRVKFVEPGATAFYNVTITNTGTLPRRFEAFYEATPQGGKNWAVDMDTSAFRLEPGSPKTILVRVFAPQDAVPGVDRVSVFVRARSFPEQVNETIAESNITLFANAVEPKPITTTTPAGRVIPLSAAPLLAFAFVAVALLHRRRRE